MRKTLDSDLVRGNIDVITLISLSNGDRCLEDIIADVEQRSNGQYVLKRPTLYSALRRLETKGCIRSYWGQQTSQFAGRKKYYAITEAGHEFVSADKNEWEHNRTVLDKLISDKEYDFTTLDPVLLEGEQVSEVVEIEKTATEPEIVENIKEELSNSNSYFSSLSSEEVVLDAEDALLADFVGEPLVSLEDIEPTINTRPSIPDAALVFKPKPEVKTEPEIDNTNLILDNEPEPVEKKSEFLSYNTKSNSEDEFSLDRDYKQKLYALISNQEALVPEAPYKANIDSPVLIPAVQPAGAIVAMPNSEVARTTEIDDAISIRHYSVEAAKDHSSHLYYFSNKLHIVQSFILFGVMAIFTIISFLISFVWLQTPGPAPYFDMVMYILAIVLTAALPIITLIISSRNPERQKRIRYNFKNALLYRFVLFVNCLLIIYAINAYLGMGLSFQFGLNHIASLLLPSLFALCIPLSSIIFYGLFVSGRYSVK